jgi:sec-independent protein translocase protein TatC
MSSTHSLPDSAHPAGQMHLMDHLEELRDRVVKSAIAVLICTIITATFTTQIIEILLKPYGSKMVVLHPTEGITIYFWVAFSFGVALSLPFILYQFIMFILPGLESHEKRYIYWGVPAAALLFLIGAAFAWEIMLPAAIGFLSTWQPDLFTQQWQANEYIPFVTSLLLWLGLSFETPLIIFIMAKLGLVTPQFLIKQWRFAVVFIAILAAFITPTVDPLNMFLVMIPLLLLYGISILLSFLA